MNEFIRRYVSLKPHRTPEEARAKYKKYIKRNQLWFIVQQRSPHVDDDDVDPREKYMVIRDIRSKRTRPHYLVIPRRKIVGLESPSMNTVRDIFTFAWNVQVPGIPNDNKTLIVNPKQFRSQDQLHVHIVQTYKKPNGNVTTVDHLDNVLKIIRPGEGVMIWRSGDHFCVSTESKFSFESRFVVD